MAKRKVPERHEHQKETPVPKGRLLLIGGKERKNKKKLKEEQARNAAVDTHFIVRGRIVRAAQCVVTNPGCIGIGLEEDTAAFVTEGREILVKATPVA
ncbi:hypothetical protein [Pontibacter pamirensis]|uniref:hypothetical protein n=1 Tax=Pontibacter pamirensis TaxID=2562824 RepID=UPI00192E3D3C|nr:hypothetical protein [Pontibacter pamirensis]